MANSPTQPPYAESVTLGSGDAVTIETYAPSDFAPLVEMYQDFTYADRKQGVPPKTESAIRQWLEGVLGDHSLIVTQDNSIVGHALFSQDSEGGYQFGVFVHPEFKSAGLKQELVSAALDFADQQSIDDIWLTLGTARDDSLEMYRFFGFETDSLTAPVGVRKLSHEKSSDTWALE